MPFKAFRQRAPLDQLSYSGATRRLAAREPQIIPAFAGTVKPARSPVVPQFEKKKGQPFG
jgi:hypothetical protein